MKDLERFQKTPQFKEIVRNIGKQRAFHQVVVGLAGRILNVAFITALDSHLPAANSWAIVPARNHKQGIR
jgi:hypothetical protein